jgi:hypothetical protein
MRAAGNTCHISRFRIERVSAAASLDLSVALDQDRLRDPLGDEGLDDITHLNVVEILE